jgi:hypothetical protein
VVGPLGAPIWIKAAPSALKAAIYDTHVDPDSGLPQTKAIREQKAIQTYGLLRTNPFVAPFELTRMLVNEMNAGDKYALLMNPLMGSTEANPMTIEEAMQAVQQVQPQIAQLQERFAQLPAQGLPAPVPGI